MSERKVLNKYYPPDFDPAKIPRMKLPKNRQYTVRLMAPFNMRCATCGEYIYKGKKFNARKEDVENEDYLGIRIYRFYIKCTRCLQEISFKTDPRNTDYEIEAGATRNFMALKLAEEQAVREEEEAREEEANNPMKLLENRTKQSKNEIELLESLEELKDLNRRQQVVDYDTMLSVYDTTISEREREERVQQMDEEYIKGFNILPPACPNAMIAYIAVLVNSGQSINFQSNQKRKLVVEEEIIEEVSEPPPSKTSKNILEPSSSTNNESEATSNEAIGITSWAKGKSNVAVKKNKVLQGLVRIRKDDKQVESSSAKSEECKMDNRNSEQSSVISQKATNSLSLLGAYSDSENSSNDD